MGRTVNLTIELEAYYDKDYNRRLWRADCKEMPGTPPVGISLSPIGAVVNMFDILEDSKSYKDTLQMRLSL